jgi:hypothetical protein
MFLSGEELSSMTNRVQHKAQAKMLRSMGVEFRTRADGTLAVLRAHVDKVFGNAAESVPKKKSFQPNWDGVNA